MASFINLNFGQAPSLGGGATLGFLFAAALILVSVIWLFYEGRNAQFIETNQAKKNNRVKIAATVGVVGILGLLILGFILFIW